MKKLTLFAAAIISVQFLSAQYCGHSGINSGPAVCIPQGITQPGLNPDDNSLPPLINGAVSGTVLEFRNWDSIANPVTGANAYMDSLTFDSIGNLPAGLCWCTNKATNTFGNIENGCIVISGTTCAPPGQYQLFILVTMWNNPPLLGTNPTGPIPMSAMGMYYYVRVNNSGQATVIIDTTGQQEGSNDYVAYGNQASCQAGPPSVSFGNNQTICNNSNLILDPVITGGAAPYTYSWQSSGSALSCYNCSNPSSTLVYNSTYSVTVTDANNFTASANVTYTTSATNNAVLVTAVNSNVTCASSIDNTTITVTGGTLPLGLNWGDGSTQTGISSLSPTHQYTGAGIYPIAVTDASGCSTAIFDTILNTGVVATLANTVNPHCWGMATGSLQVGVTGGTAPYSYSWSNGSTTNTASGITAGYYDLIVTDNTGCSAAFNYYLAPLSDPWGYYAYTTAASANCNNNGSANVTVYGGLPPYNYAWSNGNTTQNISGLSSGRYTITVSDSVGCQTTGNAYINSSCFTYITGTAFSDSNGNCIYDAGDAPLSYLYITAVSSVGDYFYGSSDANGNYSVAVNETGTFTLSAAYYYNYACGNLTFCNNNNQTITVSVLGDSINNNNIGFENATGFNLGIHPGWTSADPGFTKQYWVYYYNSSAVPFNGPAVVTFVYDSNLLYQSSDETPAPVVDANAHTLTWTVNFTSDTLTGGYFNWVQLDGYFQVPSTLSLNYQLQSDFRITPVTGDCDSSDNHYRYSETVIGSHDPNEKTVEPAGPVTASDSILTYTIHFQNTGTDSTHFIVIKDTLSPSLDPTTVRNIASSDKYSNFSIAGKGILTWTFNPLRVVDSATNPSGSKRFITFTVKKKSNLPIGTTISNTASVYFDYNTAVVTNTVTDTESLPTGIFEVSNNSNVSVKAFPNPFSDVTNIVVTGLNEKFGFELYDVTGRLQQSNPSVGNNQFELHRGLLAKGVYLYRIIVASKPTAYGKLVIE